MVIGIVKNNIRIIGNCEIKEIIVSNNKFKTIICNGIPAVSRDRIIFICDICEKENETNKRVFCGYNSCNCLCQRCLGIKTSKEKYGVSSPNQCATVKEKQHLCHKKEGTVYVNGNIYQPRKTKTPEELSQLRSKNAKQNWVNGNYDNIDYSYLKKNWENPEFREKSLKRLRSPENRKKQSELSKARWLDPNYRSTIPGKISKSILSNSTEIERRRAFTKSLWDNDYDGQVRNLLNISKRFSKLHVKISSELKLSDKGFIGEQRVGRYLVDELNIKSNIVIEINGDYIHANPKKYQSTDIIKLPGNSYTASEKWESDKIKIDSLEKMGFRVLIIWQSDDLIEVSKKLENMLSSV